MVEFVDSRNSPTMAIRFSDDRVDYIGTNIRQLGWSLIHTQNLINTTARYEVQRGDYSELGSQSDGYFRRGHPYYFDAHLGAVNKGSVELIVNLFAQPELRTLIQDERVQAFGIGVLANLVTTAGLIASGKWREMWSRGVNFEEPTGIVAQKNLANWVAPDIEKLARCVTPKGGIGRIDFYTKDANGTEISLKVDRNTRENIFDYAESSPTAPIDLYGEVRKVDLDLCTALLVHKVTGERIEIEFAEPISIPLPKLLGRRVLVSGRERVRIQRRDNLSRKIEITHVKTLD